MGGDGEEEVLIGCMVRERSGRKSMGEGCKVEVMMLSRQARAKSARRDMISRDVEAANADETRIRERNTKE